MSSLYNLYSPKNLENIIGQTFIINILKNMLDKEIIPNAIIFSGIHGVGKTLLARLFAEEISKDIIEIDGVTYSGIDNIRSLLEDALYAPMHSKYKIYIIDEVHMLSRQAFDCLLLTLQSPPSHIKFFFATTNLNKIPDTILSRCVILPLNKINNEDIYKYINNIILDLKISIQPDAIKAICKYARGSLRSAISMLNILYYINEEITLNLIESNFKQLSKENAIIVLEYILQGDTNSAISHWKKYFDLNYTEKSFFQEMIEIISQLSIYKFTNIENEYSFLFDKYYLSNALLLHYWDILANQYTSLNNNTSHTVEISIIMMSTVQITNQLSASISQAFPAAKVLY